MTCRITLHLNSGQSLVTHEAFPEGETLEDVREFVHDTIFPEERPQSPYRDLGDNILVHYQNVAAIEVERFGRTD